ncbi:MULTISPECIES: asparagine synthase-related protein [Pseudofrankia]|uniref:asparagine synthase-related protein n=1 Tax=Pseudofrankia TaxID=2994363 RepID=UPI000234D059|nr:MULTISPECIES: asparagine synthase-related protein [Pseudofrankia]OHV39814.1 asparagine synthase [Pseudofrankia sp. EUN1h]
MTTLTRAMPRTPRVLAPGAPWFAVLPDTPAGGALGAAVLAADDTVAAVRRGSGRPWLIGRWAASATTTADSATAATGTGTAAGTRAGSVTAARTGAAASTAAGIVHAAVGRSRLALIGDVPIGPGELADRLARVRDVADLDQLANELPGSFHLVAEIDGHGRVQGTASGLRRVFHAGLSASPVPGCPGGNRLDGSRLDGAVVAGDRADVVMALSGDRPDLDLTALALCLVDPVAPHPLDDRPLWLGLTAVPPDHWLRVDPPGTAGPAATHRRWWHAPKPELDGRVGAAALRRALVEAVGFRTAAGGTVTADLSGGLDSTALCFLAAAGAATVVPYTGVGRDPADEDAAWAALARAALPGAADGSPGAFELLPRERVPLVYDGIGLAGEPLDRPFIGVIDRAKLLAGLRLAGRHRPRLHLCGLGGDEVAQGSPNCLAGLALGHPLAAYARLRALRAQGRWPLAASVWTLRPRSYRTWLADLLAPASRPDRRRARAHPRRRLRRLSPRPVAELDWSIPPRIPAWLTPRAVELLRAALTEAVEEAEPLGPTRDRHADLFAIRAGAAVARGFAQLAAPTGPPLTTPFYDDRVVEAALAVRTAERCTPWEYKPLLKAAMRFHVPADCLRRQTKAEGSVEEEAGLRTNQDALRALFTGSRLAALGLVDEEALLRACRYTPAPDLPHLALQQTAAAEVWLRAWDIP